jgi:DNA polymerase bacteriophage-type
VTELHIDFETFSACELRDAGLDNYAKHPTTGVHCMAWTMGDEPVDVWTPADGRTFSMREVVFKHIAAGGTVVAHNAAFEWAIWNHVCVPKYGWPPLRIEQMRCTMAQAYAMALPGALEKLAPALGIEQQKDMAGARVMMQLAKPKLDGSFWTPADDPDKFAKLYAYCKQDVVVEREADRRMMRLSDAEQRLWTIDQRINQRGIQVDLAAIDAAIALVESEKARLNAEILKATGGVVGSATEVQLLVKWIRQFVEIKGLAKADVLDALKVDDMPPAVRRALQLRQEAAKSSTAKLVAMKQRASSDGRVRGTKQYHGAGTGRWAGRGMQTDNFPRGNLKPHEVQDVLNQLLRAGNAMQRKIATTYIDMMYGPPMDVMASCLRGMITATPGNELVACDFSNIEGRVLAWLAGEEWKLQAFRDYDKRTGPDLYLVTAGKIYHREPTEFTKTSPEREVGKRCELAFGFGGGLGAWRKFETYATADYVPFKDESVHEIKNAWRDAHPKLTRYWHDLESAALNAVDYPGTPCKAGAADRLVTFKKAGSFLWCRLPSGRVLCYPYARIDSSHTMVNTKTGARKVVSGNSMATNPLGLDWRQERSSDRVLWFWGVNGVTNKWEEMSTYGGSLAENVTQAVARDVLAEAIVRLDDAGHQVVMHVHDEVVCEVPAGVSRVEEIETLMCQLPAWAAGLPVAAEGWQGFRYRK